MPDDLPVLRRADHREPGVAMRYCTNAACPAQLQEHPYHFVSRGAMDIDGLGAKLVDRFVDLGWINDVADIYHLDWEAVSELEGLGEKSAANLRASGRGEQAATTLAPDRRARHPPRRRADRQLLADRFGSIDALMEADV